MERSHWESANFTHGAPSFNPFQGLWNVLTMVDLSSSINSTRFNPFQGLWNVHTSLIFSLLFYGKVSIPFRDYGTFSPGCSFLRIPCMLFQSLSGIMERSHDAPLLSWSLHNCFNPFQGLWNVLTFKLPLQINNVAVSIPFRDYGTFSLPYSIGCKLLQ